MTALDGVQLGDAQRAFAQAPSRADDGRRVLAIFQGGPGSGKTTSLAARAASLVKGGSDPQRIVIIVMVRTMVDPMRGNLSAFGVPDVKVLTVAQLACLALACDGVPARQVPRFWEAAVLQELKTSGVQVKRLREMVKFFRKGLEDLDCLDPDWLITGEERSMLQMLRDGAREMGGYLGCELGACALGALDGNLRWDDVLVDDFSSMSRSQQELCLAVAGKSVSVTGYPEDPGYGIQEYPDPCGLARFSREFDGVVHVFQAGEMVPSEISRCASHPGCEPSEAAQEPRTRVDVRYLVNPTPDDEFLSVSVWASGLLSRGVMPGEVAVIAPNRAWVRRISERMVADGIPVATYLTSSPLGGDPGSLAHCAGQRAATLLALAADPEDTGAWRMWLGFGDSLMRTSSWIALRDEARKRHLSPVGLLRAAVDDPRLADGSTWGRLIPLASSAIEGIGKLDGLRGCGLVDALGPAIGLEATPLEVRDLLADAPGCADAHQLDQVLRNQVDDPVWTSWDGKVRVGVASAFAGIKVGHVCMCGLVDGFDPGPECFSDRLPPDIKERNLTRSRGVHARNRVVATEELLLSRFEHEFLVEAEPARMEISRIKAAPGGRMASIRPSAFWDQPTHA